MRVHTSCNLELSFESPTPIILMLRPQSGFSQNVSKETCTFSHPVRVVEYSDIFGNLCQRLVIPAGDFNINTSAEVEAADKMDVEPNAPLISIQDLPIDTLCYLVPSRYCESDKMGNLATEIVGNTMPGYNQVDQITNWIRENVTFKPGSSWVPLSAMEVHSQGFGVCRDLAHLGISLCRSICIPARMVVGYLVGLKPMDMHAWFEAYVGNRWYAFDPTQKDLNAPRIAIAYGRDAADVSIIHQFGLLPETSELKVSVNLAFD